MNEIIKACIALEEKYGRIPFDEALPRLQKGWWEIAEKHGTTGDQVLKQYMDWRSQQKE
ncbi:hypothetical protein P0100_18480 [Yersinia pestis]|uniref:hypothetical protein n=1 Tax=Paenibacillus lautus TaxID=1401 RepID=UPI002562ABF8|nr:hypothetical protein [Paenibacillus lautus]MDL1163025.1 hypothetical protein [Yersinia pestis]MEC0257711.1 hypothetical protein [Paenibacillus lautus]